MSTLFRKEALQARSGASFGSVQLRAEASYDFMAAACFVLVIALIAILFLGTYSRQIHLDGVLESSPFVGTGPTNDSAHEGSELVAHFIAPLVNIRTYTEGRLIPLAYEGLPTERPDALRGRIYAVNP